MFGAAGWLAVPRAARSAARGRRRPSPSPALNLLEVDTAGQCVVVLPGRTSRVIRGAQCLAQPFSYPENQLAVETQPDASVAAGRASVAVGHGRPRS